MINLQLATIDDYDALLKMMGEAFKDDDGKPENFATLLPKLYERGAAKLENHFIVKDNDEIKANVAAIPMQMQVLGHKLNVAGIGMVSVAESARGSGYMRLLMDQAVQDIKEKKFDYGVLGGHRQRYEYFGFTPSGVALEFEIEKHNFTHVFGRGKEAKYTYREMINNDVALSKLYRLHQAKKAVVLRESENFFRTLKTWKNKPYVIYNKDDLVGYLVAGDDGYSITEIELFDTSVLTEVLADFYFNHTKREKGMKISEVQAFEEDKVKALCKISEWMTAAETCNVAIYNFMSTMQAFANLKTSYASIPDGTFVIEIKDMQKLKVICHNNNVSVIPTLDKADISVDYLLAIQLIFSMISAHTNYGLDLNPTARALFPLPLFLPKTDNV